MPYRTVSYQEAQGEVRWEVAWDGHVDRLPFQHRGSFWTVTLGIRFSPSPSGGQTVDGLQVTGQHTQGPHLADSRPGFPVAYTIDPIALFSERGNREWGSWTTPHTATGGNHGDRFRLSSRRLSADEVVLVLTGTHVAQALPAEATAAVPVTPAPPVAVTPAPAPGPTPTPPATPPLAPPRAGTGKRFVFVEKRYDDNGSNWWNGALTFGEVEVESVKEMVDHILGNLGEDECIEELTIMGHGTLGYQSIGNGQSGGDTDKGLYHTGGPWEAEFARLTCKFCQDSTVTLRGCNVGGGEAGAQLLFRINQILQCAGSVRAWTGYCYPTHTTGEEQSTPRGATAPPTPRDAVVPGNDKKKSVKKGKKAGSRAPLIGGTRDKIMHFRAVDVEEARYLPRLPGRDLTPEGLEHHAWKVRPSLLGAFRSWIETSEVVEASLASLALDGYLQLKVRRGGHAHWMEPWGVVSGGAGLTPLGEDTGMVYALADELQASLSGLVEAALDRS